MSVGQKAVDEQQVETVSRQQLSKSVGQESPAIDCPDDLKGEVGATMTCTIKLGGKPYDVFLKVTDVQGKDVNWDVKVASKPRGS